MLDVRGPIGGFFVWRADAPALLVGGGSGLVPLMAMLRLARGPDRADRSDLVRLVASVRTPAELLYRDEIAGPGLSSPVPGMMDDGSGFQFGIAEVTMKPSAEASLSGEDATKMRRLLEALENLDDVQDVYTTAALAEA